MRKLLRQNALMKYAGPRIMLHHQVDGVWHCVCSVLKKDRVKK